jgi:hypothetical protein
VKNEVVNEVKAPPSRKERKLQREVAQLRADLASSQFAAGENKGAAISASELVGEVKAYAEQRFKLAEANIAALETANADLDRTRRIAADSLLLERDELLTRVRRIEFRIQGLGITL